MSGAAATRIAATALALAVPVAAAAAETAHLRRKAPSNTETVIGVGARFDKACRSVGLFDVVLDEPPQHGSVCVLTGTVKPSRLLAGSGAGCLHQPMQGVQIVYRSDPNFVGRDTLRYTLKSPRISQPHQVEIEMRPAASAAPGPDFGFATPRQTPGPMPACVALTS